MKHIKGSFAKDITRQAVIDLFYQFAANKKAMLVSSLPGTSWEFEKHVAKMSNFYSTFTTKEWSLQGMMYLAACENNNKIYKQEGFHSVMLELDFAKWPHNEDAELCCYDKRDMWSPSQKEVDPIFSSFQWHDYCGLPTKKVIDNINFLKNKSVFIFTFSTSWRRKDSIPKELKNLAEKYGEAEAVCSYFSFLAKEHGYKLLFKCEYKSSRTPMVIFALTNDKKLRSPKIIDLYADKLTEGRKRMTNKLNDLAPEIKEQVYTCLKDNVEDGVILAKYGISKKRLGSYKAHITMGNR
jgi:hypothetical protein